MTLFYYQPDGHGPKSFFVMAENEKEADIAIRSHIKRWFLDDYDSGEYDPAFLERAQVGEVIQNDND